MKIILNTRYYNFKYQVISIRLFNIWTNIQNYDNKIILKKFNIFIIVYFDNILINIKDLRQVYVNSIYLILN